MAIVPQVTWEERIQHSLARERESDAYSRVTDDDADNPYWTKDDVERLHTEISQRIIAMMSPEDLEMFGSDCVVGVTMTQGAPLPQDCLKIFAATIQRHPGDTTFYPADGPASIAEWYQMLPLDVDHCVKYAIVEGKVVFKGESISLLYLREPTLAEFQNDAEALPPAGYVELASDWVHQMLSVNDGPTLGRA